MSEAKKSNVLYVKGKGKKPTTQSESELEEDVWDDTKLRAAYDKAMCMANAVEVAKRVAMSTNSHTNSSGGRKKPHSKSSHSEKPKHVWKPDMHCRAIYEGDGLEYEAKVEKILNEDYCIVLFLGYNNSEVVPISSLKPSLGKDVQAIQILEAAYHEDEELLAPLGEKMDISDRSRSPVYSEHSNDTPRRAKKKKASHSRASNGFKLPDIPMANINMLAQGLPNDMLIPPPPVNFPSGRIEEEEQAMSSMLLSWYMSGYYAGLYQGLKRSKSSQSKPRR